MGLSALPARILWRCCCLQIKTLNVFPRERTIVARERARGGYSLLPYLLSKLAAELPVGALFPALFGAIVYPATGLNARASRCDGPARDRLLHPHGRAR